MHISAIRARNFRLLKNFEIGIEAGVTVIVGRNNSGKTSLTDLCGRLFKDPSTWFRLEDFHLSSHGDFKGALDLFRANGKEDEIRAMLPTIDAEFDVDYDAGSPISPAVAVAIIDMEESCHTVRFSISYRLKDGFIGIFFNELESFLDEKTGAIGRRFWREIGKRIKECYTAYFEFVDPNDAENRKVADRSQIMSILSCGFIGAQRSLDEDTKTDKAVIGKILEAIFIKAASSGGDQEIVGALRTAVSEVEKGINKDFNENLDKMLRPMSILGYPRLLDPKIRTQTELDVEKLLKDHTTIGYELGTNSRLPESYNGLGPRNIIVIVLKLIEAYKQRAVGTPVPTMQLVFIEEPEAHLHPQMQGVFIRQLKSLAREIPGVFGAKDPWHVQFIVTTHSSHIANEAQFEEVRYFHVGNSQAGIPWTEAKPLVEGLKGETAENRKFLHKYMTLTRCDLLFADACVLIEGWGERVFLPSMIRAFDESERPKTPLGSLYISIVEVGGAHAHILRKLIDFLGIRTLIVTDIDTVKRGAKGKLEACLVSQGEGTSNQTIKSWFSGQPSLSPVDLIGKSDGDKTQGCVRLAYQIPEQPNGPCGRSLEDAFILTNPARFGLDGTAADLDLLAYDLAAQYERKKSDFAIEHGIMGEGWATPKYIKDGLRWLSQTT